MSRRSRSWTTFSSLARRIGGAFRRSPWAFSAAAAAAFTALWLLRYGPYALGVGLVPTVGLLFLFFCVGLLHGLDRVLPVALLLVLGLTLLAGAAVDLVAGKAGYDVGFTQWSYVEALSAALSVSGAYAAGYFIASSSSYTTRPLHAEEAKAEREVEVKAERAPPGPPGKALSFLPSALAKARGLLQRPQTEKREKREPLI